MRPLLLLAVRTETQVWTHDSDLYGCDMFVGERSAGGERKVRAQQKREDAPSVATSCLS